MKKIVKILGIILVVIIAAVFIIPIVFEGKIIEMVKKTANNNINGTLDFADADLSIWSSFPSAEVTLNNTSLVNNAPFEGDTLFQAKQIDLKLPIVQLFKSGADISITTFTVEEANLAIKIDENGNANYDIAKETEKTSNTPESEPTQLNLEGYTITNSKISYNDASSKMTFLLDDFNHKGEGNLSAATSKLKTQTDGLISLEMDSVAYLNNNKIDLEALIGIDLNENKYTFLENKALINQLPLVFDGFVKINEKNQEVNINFKTPSSDFKNFLALIPEVYSKNIEGVQTTGNFDVNGKFEGVVDETHIPKFDIVINSDNASFKYPDLPKSLQNININTKIANETGLAKDTYVNIDTLSFRLDKEVFNASAKLTEVTENMKVKAHLDGNINLANLEQVYPADVVKDLKGNLAVNANTSFDMNSIENKKYENTRTSGTFTLKNFEYVSAELSDKLVIDNTSLILSPKTVKLNSFDAKLGKTDIQATGNINNLIGFLFNKEEIEGRFSLNSNIFSINDFMVAETDKKEDEQEAEKNTSKKESIQIPSFLNCTIDAKANTVLYDNITLKNVSGTLLIKDQTATLKNMKSNVFNGVIGFEGNVSTKTAIPTFAMNLDMNSLNIDESFKQLNLLEALAPIAKVIQGKLNTNISLSGNLKDNFTPDLNTLSGKAIAELVSSKLSSENSPIISKLEEQLSFLDTKKLNLNDLKTALTFKDGKVQVNPFSINYEDIKIDVSGGHGFDNTLGYEAVINVPAKYLGSDVTKLIAQLSEQEGENIKIPVNAMITGKFSNPEIKTDFKAAVTDLTKQLVAKQKEKLIDKGKDKVGDALKDLLGGKDKPKDSTTTSVATDSVKKPKTTPKVEDVAKDALKDLFGKKKKAKDTIN
ncbi:AsmA-like C-terminal region-containing protein [Aureibaculum sp. 2210JD6-5]|uniref:AsmA-like C-terminal region-containing protein n=1 Tax=Aureibaculum sp. 2210JD6-5 TaxID=3103957 RepID=UPI002AAE44F9|nr:AsmA-like C-terminal region-containing protein [Aureibaculum sp. 2210JD6-5]MDY7394731.1 AsmA-like C-terminal region-containing protein [Aureibaculum sp. 2210JD6-5]